MTVASVVPASGATGPLVLSKDPGVLLQEEEVANVLSASYNWSSLDAGAGPSRH